MSALQQTLFDCVTPRAGQLISVTHTAKPLRFAGPTYEPRADNDRLTGQLFRVFKLMRDGGWRTLREIADTTGDPEASISAQLRHLKKPHFGGHGLEKRIRGERTRGLYEYRLTVNQEASTGPRSRSAWLVPVWLKMDILLMWKHALELGVEESELRELLGGYGCTSRKELTPEQARDFTSELSRLIRARSNHA